MYHTYILLVYEYKKIIYKIRILPVKIMLYSSTVLW